MPIAYGYTRVSTPRQGESGLGLEGQRIAIESYFAYRLQGQGFTWGGWHEDAAISGSMPLTDRPAGAKLSLALERGDAVVFSKLDRGFRNLLDLLRTHSAWQGRGASLHCLDVGVDTSTPAGKMVLSILGAVAEFEWERASERTLAAHESQRRRGLPCGGACPPYGFSRTHVWKGNKRETRYLADPHERSLGQLIVSWRKIGYNWEEILKHLHRNGLRNKHGRPWSWGGMMRAYHGELKLQAKELLEAQAKK